MSLLSAPLAALTLVGLTTACSEAPGHAEGTVTGHLYGVGGPAPGLPRAWPGAVTLTGRGVHLDVTVPASGRFSATVPPGRYTLVGRSPRYGNGTYLCRAAKVVTVASGQIAKADVLCQMK